MLFRSEKLGIDKVSVIPEHKSGQAGPSTRHEARGVEGGVDVAKDGKVFLHVNKDISRERAFFPVSEAQLQFAHVACWTFKENSDQKSGLQSKYMGKVSVIQPENIEAIRLGVVATAISQPLRLRWTIPKGGNERGWNEMRVHCGGANAANT